MRAAIAYLEASRRDADELVDRSMVVRVKAPGTAKGRMTGFAPAADRRARRKRSPGRGARAPSQFHAARQAP